MTRESLTLGWTLTLSVSGALLLLAFMPPFVGGEVGHAIHYSFGSVCHQLAERSPHLSGSPIALCHRCTGILSGVVLGLALSPFFGRAHLGLRGGAQGRILLAAGLPTAIDWVLGATGLWANTPASRLVTGAVFGLVAGGILAANLLAPRRRPSPPFLTHAQ